jgi:hypothetical protein
MPRPAQADIRCSTVATLAEPLRDAVVAMRVSDTAVGRHRDLDRHRQVDAPEHDAGVRRAGRSVSSTRCPLCRPTPTARVWDLRVRWRSIAG